MGFTDYLNTKYELTVCKHDAASLLSVQKITVTAHITVLGRPLASRAYFIITVIHATCTCQSNYSSSVIGRIVVCIGVPVHMYARVVSL